MFVIDVGLQLQTERRNFSSKKLLVAMHLLLVALAN